MPRAAPASGTTAEPHTHARDLFWTPIVACSALAVLAIAVSVGADSMWLVALGKQIVRHRGIPSGVPFAGAPSRHWPNVPALGEMLFAALHRLGTLGLPIFQLVTVAVLFGLTGAAARRMGARDGATATILLVSAFGALPAIAVLRAQSMSLIPFALLVILLRSESGSPSRRVWLVPVLLAVWGNLHGAVLLGLAVAGCYLLFARLRIEPATATAVLGASVLALGVNPAGVRTVAYYAGVLTNEAAHGHTGLWARPSLTDGFDVLLLIASLVLVALGVGRRPGWEYPAVTGLALATLSADRNGVWLLLFCAAPAAARLSRLRSARPAEAAGVVKVKRTLVIGYAVMVLILATVLLATRTAQLRKPSQEAATVREIAHGRVVLATEPLAETLAASDVRVWLCNPIDAFDRADQAAYLDFIAGHGPGTSRALAAAGIVVAEAGSKSERLASQAGFTVIGHVDMLDILSRA